MILRQRVVHELYYSKTDVRVSVKITTQKDTAFFGEKSTPCSACWPSFTEMIQSLKVTVFQTFLRSSAGFILKETTPQFKKAKKPNQNNIKVRA